MLPFDQALTTILAAVEPLAPVRAPIMETLGQVLAEDVFAPRDLPPRANSAMDGFAVRHADVVEGVAPLRLLGEIPAAPGDPDPVLPGCTVKIMTGAPIPPGCDTVVPVEEASCRDGQVHLSAVPERGAFVRPAGEDVKAGSLVLTRGTVLRPDEIAMLAALGRSQVRVGRRPRVAILSTGDEIVDIDAGTDGGAIIDSNSYGLTAKVREAGGDPLPLGIGGDDPDRLLEALQSAEGADLVLTTGGVSMGDYDYMRQVFERWGVEIRFWKIAMRPGRPVVFGVRSVGDRQVPVLGLPGNPVSALVTFDQFARPVIRRQLGARRTCLPCFEAVLTEAAGPARAHRGLTTFLRCTVARNGNRLEVVKVDNTGSGVLSGLTRSNALLVVPAEATEIRPGQTVTVQIQGYEALDEFPPGELEGLPQDPGATPPSSGHESQHPNPGSALETDMLVEVRANLDDMSAELMATLIDACMSAGAVDAWLTPALMKKGRPAQLLTALCRHVDLGAVEEAIFRNSTTLGVRKTQVSRSTLQRTVDSVDTPWGTVRVKVGLLGGEIVNRAPEFDDCKRLADEAGVPLKEVFAAALGRG